MVLLRIAIASKVRAVRLLETMTQAEGRGYLHLGAVKDG